MAESKTTKSGGGKARKSAARQKPGRWVVLMQRRARSPMRIAGRFETEAEARELADRLTGYYRAEPYRLGEHELDLVMVPISRGKRKRTK